MDQKPIQPTEAQRLIYARTAAGDAEIAARQLPLSASARRLLVLVNGRRAVALLSNFVRAGEFDALIAELRQHALIAAAGTAAAPDEANRLARQRAEQATLQATKRRLQGLFEAELGSAGLVWDARVIDSVNLEVLRRVLREGVDTIFYRRGETAARRVVALLRPVLEKTRQPL
ncbi:MAG: hypothetical protein WCY32_14180 [Burkholderiaceae bacterium]